MSVPSVIALQKAVYGTLAGDATLMALAGGIFDHVLQGSGFPYVVFGESMERAWFNREKTGSDQLLTLQVYSRAGGRKEAGGIMERIYALLHHAALTVEGQALILLRYTAGRIELENDGVTYKGSIQFRALLQES